MKRVIITGPQYYGIDEDIGDAFKKNGYEPFLKQSWTKLTAQERIARRLGQELSPVRPFLNTLFKYYLIKKNRNLLAVVKKEKPDLIFVINGDHIFPDTLKEIKKDLALPIVIYLWDDPFYNNENLYRDIYRKSNFRKGMKLYDYIFVFDTFYVEDIRRRGIGNIAYLPLATNPDRFKIIPLSEEDKKEYGYDICFVGSPFRERIQIFESLQRYNLGVFGDEWEKLFLFQGKNVPPYYKGKANGEKVLKIYSSSKIVLNIHHPHSVEGLNTRTFDIPVCGGFELVDYKKNLERHFKIGKEIAAFKSQKDLIELIDFYLCNPELTKKIAALGRQRVLKEHTWGNRIEELISKLQHEGILK